MFPRMRKDLPQPYVGPLSLWQGLLTAMAVGGSGGMSTNNVGVTPFHTPILLHWLKILQTRKFVLKQGQSASFSLRWKKPFTMWGYDMDNTYVVNPRQYVTWLIICYGQPTNDSITKTNVGTSNIAYDFMDTRTYKWVVGPGNVSETNWSSGLTALTNNSIINIGSGAVIDAAVAANIA